MPRITPLLLIAAATLVFLPALPASGQAAGDPAPGAAPPAEQRKKREPIYDEKADAKKQVAEALARAKKENRRVLIQWGANWCGWCYLLHDHFAEAPAVKKKLLYEYDVVLVDVGRFDKNVDLAEHFGADFKNNGVPYLTILDADGKPLANQETGSLEKKTAEGKNGHDATKVLAFLETHQAPYLPAESIMKEALARAKAEDKRVFLHFGAPWCGWCHRLEDWLAKKEIAAILAKDFVEVKIDIDRTIGGNDILKRMTRGVSGGIPWFAFLDPDGTVVADSFMGGKKNLGCPYTDEEIVDFARLLEKVTKRIDREEIRLLATDLEKGRKKTK